MNANKVTGTVIAIIVAFLLLTGAYFFGYSSGKKNNSTVPPIVTYADTTKKVTVPIKPSIDIDEIAKAGTVKYKYKIKYIPVGVDSSIANELLRQNDSLLDVLGSMNVKRVSVLDTLIGELKDTVKIAHEVIQDYWKVHVGISPRVVDVKTEIRTIYIPPPPREWWDNPYVSGGTGIVVGLVVGLLIK